MERFILKIWSWIKNNKLIAFLGSALFATYIAFGPMVIENYFRGKAKLYLKITPLYEDGFYFWEKQSSQIPNGSLSHGSHPDGGRIRFPVKILFNNIGEKTIIIKSGLYNNGGGFDNLSTCRSLILLDHFDKITMPIDEVYDRVNYPISIKPLEELEFYSLIDIDLTKKEMTELKDLAIAKPEFCIHCEKNNLLLLALNLWSLIYVPCPECNLNVEQLAVKSISFNFYLNDGTSKGGYSFPFPDLPRIISFLNGGNDTLSFCNFNNKACYPTIKQCDGFEECAAFAKLFKELKLVANIRYEKKEDVKKIYKKIKKEK